MHTFTKEISGTTYTFTNDIGREKQYLTKYGSRASLDFTTLGFLAHGLPTPKRVHDDNGEVVLDAAGKAMTVPFTLAEIDEFTGRINRILALLERFGAVFVKPEPHFGVDDYPPFIFALTDLFNGSYPQDEDNKQNPSTPPVAETQTISQAQNTN